MTSKNNDHVPLQPVVIAALLLISFPVTLCLMILINPDISYVSVNDDPGLPLFLTPLIEQNKTDDARIASEVYFNGFKHHVSFSGYFTVDKKFNSNLFFWFFPSEGDYKTDPIILWLNGDLGTSSVYGLFIENGPFSVKFEHGLREREQSWTKNNSILYIDSPVGSGFSFTDQGYAQNQTKAAEDIYNALEQFLKVFPELETNSFFIAAEGYACKSAAILANQIHEQMINLRLGGLIIQNGFCSPVDQVHYSNFLYQTGLIDANAKAQLKVIEDQILDNIQKQNYNDAFALFKTILFDNNSLVLNLTGFQNFDNFLNPVSSYTSEKTLVVEYVQRNDVRAAIHVGNQPFFEKNANVIENLKTDILQSVSLTIANLLDYYRVLFYHGQLDVSTPYPLLEKFLQNLNFSGSEKYKNAQRNFWNVGEDLGGYFKTAENLTEVFVRQAGYFVTADKPDWIYDLVNKFTRNKVLS